MLRIDLRDDFKWALYRLGGKMAAAWAVRRWGDPEEGQPSGVDSPTTGARWTLKNLFFAWLAGAVSGELVARFFNKDGGQHVYDGACDLVVTKAWWSEVIHRIGGEPGAAMFGQDDEMAALSAQASEGDVLDDGQGNRWLLQGGKWVGMMGEAEDEAADEALARAMYAGQLEQATPLDGYQQRQLQAGEFDGVLESATPLDGYGHLMDPDTSAAASSVGAYVRRGSPDPFQASYL